MKPVFNKTTLSLALAAAAISGCSGGAETGQHDNAASAFRQGLPPSIRDGDKLALNDANVDYLQALRSAALKLTGSYPTFAEIQELRDSPNQPMIYANRIDDYLNRPTFNQQQVSFWRNTLKMGAGETVGSPAANLDFAPVYAAWVVTQGLPITNLVTATTGTCPTYNANTMAITPGNCAPGNPVVGVLGDMGAMQQFFSSMGFRRTRWTQETFMCVRFPAEQGTPAASTPPAPTGYVNPWPWTSITGNDTVTAPATPPINFLVNSGLICANCHATINHIAPLFAPFDMTGKYVAGTFQVLTPLATPRNSVLTDYFPTTEKTSWRYLKPVADLPALGAAIAADPGFARCMATRVWNWGMSRGDVVNDGTVITDDVATPLVNQLSSDSYNVKNLIRRVFNDPNFVRY